MDPGTQNQAKTPKPQNPVRNVDGFILIIIEILKIEKWLAEYPDLQTKVKF